MACGATVGKAIARSNRPPHNAAQAQAKGIRVTKALISGAWDEAKAIFARDGALLVTVVLAMVVLPEVLSAVIAPRTNRDGTSALLALVTGAVGIVGQLALIRLALGPSTTVGAAIGHGLRRFPAAFAALVLVMVAMIAICLPFAIVGSLLGAEIPSTGHKVGPATALLLLILLMVMVAASVRFMMTSAIAVAEPAGPLAIVRRSWDLTRGHYFTLLGLLLSLFLVLIVVGMVAGALGGIAARLLSPDLEPFSAGAMIVGVADGIAQGAFSLLSSLMFARVYARLSSGAPTVGVPSSAG